MHGPLDIHWMPVYRLLSLPNHFSSIFSPVIHHHFKTYTFFRKEFLWKDDTNIKNNERKQHLKSPNCNGLSTNYTLSTMKIGWSDNGVHFINFLMPLKTFNTNKVFRLKLSQQIKLLYNCKCTPQTFQFHKLKTKTYCIATRLRFRFRFLHISSLFIPTENLFICPENTNGSKPFKISSFSN